MNKKLEVYIKRIDLIVAVIALLTAIIPGLTYIVHRINLLDSPKTLEGVWEFSMNYEKFHDQTGTWHGNGKAIIVWRKSELQYEMYFGADIKKTGENSVILSGFAKGYIQANDIGLPNDESKFSIEDIRYIARMSSDAQPSSTPVYKYENCSLTKKNNRGDVIECKFDSGRSKGIARFKWESKF